MIPEHIVKLAMEKGYPNPGTGWISESLISQEQQNIMLLDPLFWQAIFPGENVPMDEYWITRAERYFHLILTGGDLDKFWEELIKE